MARGGVVNHFTPVGRKQERIEIILVSGMKMVLHLVDYDNMRIATKILTEVKFRTNREQASSLGKALEELH